jgi:hypothetical protein
MSTPDESSDTDPDIDIDIDSDESDSGSKSDSDNIDSMINDIVPDSVFDNKKPRATRSDKLTKEEIKDRKKAKKEKTMPEPKEPSSLSGLKDVKKILTDKAEIRILQEMTQDKPQRSESDLLRDLMAKMNPSPAPAPVAQPYNPMAGMDMSKVPPEQQVQYMMMQNPQMYMMNMMMQMMMNNNKPQEGGMQSMKDMAEVMTALAAMNKPKDDSQLISILLTKALDRPQQTDNNSKFMEMVFGQMKDQLEYYKSKADQMAQSVQDPLDLILQGREKFQQLSAVLGGHPEDQEIRKKQFEFDLLERQREMDVLREERMAALEERRSAKKEGMLEKGIDTVIKTIVSPIMDSVKRGYESQASGVGPRMFDPLPTSPPLDGEQLPQIPPLPNTNSEPLPPPPAETPSSIPVTTNTPRPPMSSALNTIKQNRRVPFGNPAESVLQQ